MLTVRLAFRNLMGAGLRTWLNVFVLSLAFVVIIWVQGMIRGMSEYAMSTKINYELGGGQFWHAAYDPYDPLTFEDSHAPLSLPLTELVARGEAIAVLITTGAMFPGGRVHSILIKGIPPGQGILDIPSGVLDDENGDIVPALIGEHMAARTKLGIGDYVTVRWRDINGTFDADDVQIRGIMNTTVPSVDQGQIWIPLEDLQTMLQAPGEASIVVLKKGIETIPPGDGTWTYRDLGYLLRDIVDMIKMKSASTNILYCLLLFMGLLAIFDTQVLAIWRRRKEIGTLMALGMERVKVIGLFTFEGALHGVLALAVGAVYGIPVLALTLKKGLPLPEIISSTGFAMPRSLYPSYGLRLIAGTTLLVLVSVTIVSFLPASKITKLKPTDALRGKRQ